MGRTLAVTDGSAGSAQGKAARTRRGGLGRGLDSLIPTTPTVDVTGETGAGNLRTIPVDQIVPNPWQPRSKMDSQRLQELADSIRQHGLMQPLVVTAGDNGWTLIAGERRWRAARQAGLETVPVVVMEADPQSMLELAIVENVVRADLSPLEEASAFHRLIEDFGLSQSDVASRVGRSRASVANTLRLLGAPGRIQDSLAAGDISEGHARALLGLTASIDQLAALDIVLDRGLNVRQTEALVRDWGSKRQPDREDGPGRHPDEIRIEDRLRSALGTRVSLKKVGSGKGGTLTIQFFSDEQLQGIYDRLVGEELW
jgi:ParB family chromosome partitioning protein